MTTKTTASRWTIGPGIAIWIVLVLAERPSADQHLWAALILQLAALVWVPLIPNIATDRQHWWLFGAALSLVTAFMLPQGIAAGCATLPWLLVTLWQFQVGVEWLIQKKRSADQVAQASGRIFMVVGGLWTMSDRLGWQPLDFDPAIVLLTGVHFHYAGLIFPSLVGLVTEYWPSKTGKLACWLSVAAVPLTAVGITIAQITHDFTFEAFAAAAVALSGWLTSFRYGKIAFQTNELPKTTRITWGILCIALFFTMTLALAYALRPFYPIELLNIPTMRAWHGTANAFGVAGAGLVGWRYYTENKSNII
jgi:YndJ-like protein